MTDYKHVMDALKRGASCPDVGCIHHHEVTCEICPNEYRKQSSVERAKMISDIEEKLVSLKLIDPPEPEPLVSKLIRENAT